MTVSSQISPFLSLHYRRHTARRLEHLASLGLPISHSSVLELGAGIGELSHFFLDRGCRVTAVEGRPENIEFLKSQYASLNNYDEERARYKVIQGDLEHISDLKLKSHNVVCCYGVLYHLANPETFIAAVSGLCDKFLILETAVNRSHSHSIDKVSEPRANTTQSISGTGSRPSREWILELLRRQFTFAYTVLCQPWHREFPISWRKTADATDSSDNNANAKLPAPTLSRAVFVASKRAMDNPNLVCKLPVEQIRI